MTTPGRTPVVALVCSAGGLDALTRVLGRLPVDFPAVVLVLQHLQPGHVSELADILSRRCVLPVRAAGDRVALAPGVVTVAPAGSHLLVTPTDTTALVRSGGFPPSRPSADLLLTSMGLSLGARAIAVVLSGGGHDAATGATVVHDFGGTLIAADEPSSEAYAMPAASIDRTQVDHVVDVDDIGDLLVTLVARARP